MQIPKYFYFRVNTDRTGLTIEIEDASDADVVEVVHGRWIPITNDLAKCSECEDYVDFAINCGYNYCPNCGARMDGGDA